MGIPAHVFTGVVRQQIEIVRIVGNCPAMVKPGGIDEPVANRQKFTRGKGAAHLGRNLGPVAHHLRPQIGSRPAIDDELHRLHHRPSAAVGRGVIRNADDKPLVEWLIQTQVPLDAVVRLDAVVGVQVHPVQTQAQSAQTGVDATAQQQGGMVDFDFRDIFGTQIGLAIGPGNARAQGAELDTGKGHIQTQTVEVRHGKGEGRKAGDQPVAHDGTVAPGAVAVPRHHQVVELLGPTAPVLEQLAAPALLRLAPLDPGEKIVAGGEVIPGGAPQSPRPLDLPHIQPRGDPGLAPAPGVFRVMGKGVEDKVAVEGPLLAQKKSPLPHLGKCHVQWGRRERLGPQDQQKAAAAEGQPQSHESGPNFTTIMGALHGRHPSPPDHS